MHSTRPVFISKSRPSVHAAPNGPFAEIRVSSPESARSRTRLLAIYRSSEFGVRASACPSASSKLFFYSDLVRFPPIHSEPFQRNRSWVVLWPVPPEWRTPPVAPPFSRQRIDPFYPCNLYLPIRKRLLHIKYKYLIIIDHAPALAMRGANHPAPVADSFCPPERGAPVLFHLSVGARRIECENLAPPCRLPSVNSSSDIRSSSPARPQNQPSNALIF
jgi:hypothetical protein